MLPRETKCRVEYLEEKAANGKLIRRPQGALCKGNFTINTALPIFIVDRHSSDRHSLHLRSLDKVKVVIDVGRLHACILSAWVTDYRQLLPDKLCAAKGHYS